MRSTIIDGGRGGSIILISSAARAQDAAVHGALHHQQARRHRHGAEAFAAELGRHSIRVNSVHPGPVSTDMGSGTMVSEIGRTIETYPQLANMLLGFLPMGIAEAGDIADAVLWLASDESKFVTAAAIPVDGGTTQY